MCHRYPGLKFVSVENGAGWLPFLAESMDWQWLNVGAHKDYPDRLLPSEYLYRQVYGMYWFERDSVRAVIDKLADNLMFETDFPHATSLRPGRRRSRPAPGGDRALARRAARRGGRQGAPAHRHRAVPPRGAGPGLGPAASCATGDRGRPRGRPPRPAGGHTVDPDVLHAGAADDEAVGAARLVVHPFHRRAADGGGIEGDEVGDEPLLHEPALGEAERPVGMPGQPPDRPSQRQRLALPHPVAEQVGREAGVAQLAGVGAGVGQAEERALVGQQVGDLVVAVVVEDDAEAGGHPVG